MSFSGYPKVIAWTLGEIARLLRHKASYRVLVTNPKHLIGTEPVVTKSLDFTLRVDNYGLA